MLSEIQPPLNTKPNYFQIWEGYLNGKLAEELHPNHWVAMNVKLVVIQLLSTRDLLDTVDKINRALELCDNYLEVR